MKSIICTMILFGLLPLFESMTPLAAAITAKSCEATVTNNAAKAGGVNCLAVGDHGTKYCRLGGQLMKKSAHSICLARKKRSAENNDCTSSASCITPEFIYELGKAACEPCDQAKDGHQKCIGTAGLITCNKPEWTLTEMCGQGTRCQPHPTSDRHVQCRP